MSPSRAPLLLHSHFRPPASLGPDRIVRLGGEVGAEGLYVDADVPQDLLRLVATEGLRAGLAVLGAACPLPEAELPKGKRLPYLGACDDPDERRAAVKRATGTLAFAQGLGIPHFVVDVGPVGLKTPEAPFRLGFARREMSADDDSGGKALRRALEERKARSQVVGDALRASLEPLLAEAERRGARLLLPLANGPWQAPTPREVQALLLEFTGAPLGFVYSPARRGLLGELGLGGPPPIVESRWRELVAATGLVDLGDRAGLQLGLSLGTGEVDSDLPGGLPAGLPATAPLLITGPLDASFKEVLRARRRADELRVAAEEAAAAAKRLSSA